MTIVAPLVVLLVYMASQAVKTKAPGIWAKYDLGIVALFGIGAVFLVASTDWAGLQTFGGITLDKLSVGSKIVGGLLVGAGAVGFNVVIPGALKAVSNIGQNQPVPTPTPVFPPSPAGMSGMALPHPDTIPSPPTA